MNVDTGVIYDAEQVKDLLDDFAVDAGKLESIPKAMLPGVLAMNRQQRRKWAREQRRARSRQKDD